MASDELERVPFDVVFRSFPDGSVQLKVPIRVMGIVMGAALYMKPGQSIGGIDFTQWNSRELQVKHDGDIWVIRGIF